MVEKEASMDVPVSGFSRRFASTSSSTPNNSLRSCSTNAMRGSSALILQPQTPDAYFR